MEERGVDELLQLGREARSHPRFDHNEAMRLFTIAMKRGSADAAWELGHFRKAAMLGCGPAVVISMQSSELIEDRTIVPLLEDAIRKDASQRTLLVSLWFGVGMPQDKEHAYPMMRRWADAGDMRAQAECGLYTMQDKGTRMKYALAAAMQGHETSQYQLALLLESEEKFSDAAYWFKTVACGNSLHSSLSLDAAVRLYFSTTPCTGAYDWRRGAQVILTYTTCYRHPLITERLTSFSHHNIGLENRIQRLRELWQYGHFVYLNDPRKRCCVDPGALEIAECRRVYDESNNRARSAALCLLWSQKLHKDIAIGVARSVWETRDDPAIWGVELDGEK